MKNIFDKKGTENYTISFREDESYLKFKWILKKAIKTYHDDITKEAKEKEAAEWKSACEKYSPGFSEVIEGLKNKELKEND